MAEQILPNYFADGMRAAALGRQDRDRNQFRQLATQAATADPMDRGAIIGQAAAIDAQAAGSLDKTLRSQEEDMAAKAGGAARYVLNALETKNPAAVQGAYQTALPFLTRLAASHGKQAPTQFSDDQIPGLHQLAAAASGGSAAGAVQSTYVDENGQRVAIMRDGSQKPLGGNLNNLRPIKTTLPDGREATVTFDPITGRGSITQIGGGGPTAGPVQFTGADGTPVQIGADIPPEVAAQIRAAEGGAPMGIPAVGMTPAERAAEEARGKAGVELQYAPQIAGATAGAKAAAEIQYEPQREAIKTQGDIDRATGAARVATAEKATQAAPGTIETLEQAVKAIDDLSGSPELGNIVGIRGMNPLNYLPGSKERGLLARADQVQGKAFLAAYSQLRGAGAITENEGRAATQAMARLDRAQSEADYKQGLLELRQAIQPSIDRQRAELQRARQTLNPGQPQRRATDRPQSSAVRRARNPQTGETLELRNGQWVPVR